MRRKPSNRRNNRPTPLRRLCVSRSYSQGPIRVPGGGTAGPNPKSGAGRRVPLPSYARSWGRFPLPASRAMGGLRPRAHHRPVRGTAGTSPPFGRPRQPDGAPCPSPTGPAAGLRTVSLSRTGSVGINLHDGAVRRHRFRPDPDGLFLPDMPENPVGNPALRPTVHPGADGMPTPEPERQSPPLAAMPGNVREGIGHLQVRDAHSPAVPAEAMQCAHSSLQSMPS